MSKIELFKEKIKNKELIIGVIGLGYVGLPLSVLASQKGYQVYGFDINKRKVNMLLNNKNYISDVDDEVLKEVIKENKFIPTSNFRFLDKVDVIIICVPTPLNKKGKPDLSCLYKAINEVSKYLKDDIIVIIESTTYPGTTDNYAREIFAKKGCQIGQNLFLAFSPERIDPSNKEYRLVNTNRVVGGCNYESTEIVSAFYEGILDAEVKSVSSATVAEMSKILENTYRFVNIALIFEFVKACNKLNINIWEVIDAAKTKPYGFQAFYPGAGVGGHCIPIDPIYLTWDMKKKNVKLPLINTANKIVKNVTKDIVKKIKKILKEERSKLYKILLVGVAYKRDTNDLRESPSLKIIDYLKSKKYKIDYYDSYIDKFIHEDKIYKSIDLEDVSKYDLVVICVDHSNVDYKYILKNARKILDLKNVYPNRDDVYGL
ncbi:MAG: nucleotide sugar dehydrogenase [Mollicutes bacterium]|nr:nucleotide sugar dehydrogenase [Mollicutes bacterium]